MVDGRLGETADLRKQKMSFAKTRFVLFVAAPLTLPIIYFQCLSILS